MNIFFVTRTDTLQAPFFYLWENTGRKQRRQEALLVYFNCLSPPRKRIWKAHGFTRLAEGYLFFISFSLSLLSPIFMLVYDIQCRSYIPHSFLQLSADLKSSLPSQTLVSNTHPSSSTPTPTIKCTSPLVPFTIYPDGPVQIEPGFLDECGLTASNYKCDSRTRPCGER